MAMTSRLNNCECCPRRCGVDRLAGETGFCGIDSGIRVAHAGLHFGEEPPISGTRGSGTIFFAGCNLRCVFCQNYRISQEYCLESLEPVDAGELALVMLRLQDDGAHNINFVSPSHMIFQTADAIAAARAKGLDIPVVYNSNGYDSVDALRRIRGLVDIYLPDIKYMDGGPAKLYSSAGDYAEVVPGVLREMFGQVGHLELDEDGVAVRGLLVRHLVLPGHTGNSRKCLDFLSGLSKDVHVSIMSQYSPQYRACEHPGIDRPLTRKEYDDIIDYALGLGMENAFVQEIESSDYYLPDFDRESPFDAGPSAKGPSSQRESGDE